jgi:hypothetical protein
VYPRRVVELLEQLQLSHQVICRPKEQTVQILPAEGPDEPFDKWMGPRNLGYRLHRFHSQDAQIGLPAVEPEQRIMIGTEPRGQTLPGDGLVEHAAERWPIDSNGLHAKADDPAGKLIQDDQNPVTPQQDRFGPEQVQAPETVFGMTQEREPRRSVVTAVGPVVCGQDSADHIFVEVDTKGLGQVLRDLWAAEAGIAPLEFTDGSDQFRSGLFWTGLFLWTRGVEESIFEILERTMKAQQGGGLED